MTWRGGRGTASPGRLMPMLGVVGQVLIGVLGVEQGFGQQRAHVLVRCS